MGVTGSDVSLETADVALMTDDLSKVPFLMRLGRQSVRVIRQNIAFSLFIKAVAIAAVFPGWLTLWLAVLGDMGASVLVTLNGIRLLRIDK
jgi:Cd2+/Zn2+-exporting ATPase